MAHRKELTAKEFNQRIDKALDQRRRTVERYVPGAAWIEDVASDVDSSHLSDAEVRRLYVSSLVSRREAESTRSVTNFARKIAETGQMPVDWFEYADRPIAYTIEEVDEDGNIRKQEVRVTLGSATSEDLLAWARWRAKTAKETLKVEMSTVNVFNGWAHEIAVGGFHRWGEYASAVAVSRDLVDDTQII